VPQGGQTQLEFKDVSSWLRAFELDRFEPNFANIQMKMVPFIRRSDLTANLGIPMSDPENSLNKVWDAIQKLKREFPPPLQSIDDSVQYKSHSFIYIHIQSYTRSLSHTLSYLYTHTISQSFHLYMKFTIIHMN
jgi:hypothetical protein